MKKHTCTTLIVSTFVVSLLLIGGCGKKTVVPPSQSGDANGTAITGGNDINYPMAQGGGYSEENLPIEGTLDDSTGAANQGRSLTGIDQQSYEYKQAHGRSSTGLSPIYFEFDQAGVRPAMTEVLVNNADYLNSISGVHIVIEGNSDERGTNEYNLALGERRAINTQQYLINLGVDSMRMRTVSYGEEKPLFLDQDEDSYRLNRRVDFVVE
ncbi:MAG: OmpA family protein [Desulfobulbaceae bacterium]|nr:OmpA family protein [Desulfobulbaceae bacterium]